jgi:hypothetical protein
LSKKSCEKLSSDLKVALSRADDAEKIVAKLRAQLQSQACSAPAALDAAQEPQSSAALPDSGTVDPPKVAESVPLVASESRRRVLECAPAHIVDGPAERPKRRPLSAVDLNAATSSQPIKVLCFLLRFFSLWI